MVSVTALVMAVSMVDIAMAARTAEAFVVVDKLWTRDRQWAFCFV